MSRVNKTVESNEADDHLGREDRLRKDAVIQTKRHTNKVRKQKGLPPHQVVDPVIGEGTTDEIENNRTIGDGEDAELVAGGQLIVGIRGYSAGIGRSLKGDEVVAIHRRIRRERSCFRDLNGVKVAVGEVIPRFDTTEDDSNQKRNSRKEKTRRIPGVLKSIMVRLMPAEAEAVGEAGMNCNQVEVAMDRTVEAFENMTGSEVVSAVAHRMSKTDLHIHIQYTQVLQQLETPHMLGRRLKPWKQEASKRARESLLADGVLDPSPAQIGARKKKLVAAGLLVPPPEAGIEYRKVAGKRDLGDGAILGYSFRQKLNLVRAAEVGGDQALANQVASRNDERWGRFTPIAKRPDVELEAKYLDLWLERIWRGNITSLLPQDYRDRLVLAGVEAAKNYANFGSSIVEETHIKQRIKELDEKAKVIEKAEKNAEAKRSAWDAKVAAEEEGKRLDVEMQAEKLQGELAASRAAIQQEQEKVQRLEKKIESLSHLWELAKQFMRLLMKSPIASKLDGDLKELVRAIGKIVGISFDPEKKQDGPQLP